MRIQNCMYYTLSYIFCLQYYQYQHNMDQGNFYNLNKFIERGKQMLELIQRNRIQLAKKKPNPSVEPGFLRKLIQQHPPENNSSIDEIFSDTENKILPGMMEWQSPKFFAYFPSTIAETSVYAEMFAAAFQAPGFSYAVSPAQTQLENIMMDWIAVTYGLPEKFQLRNQGGGCIMNSASESALMTVHVARERKIKQLRLSEQDPELLKFVAYYTETSHVGIMKALKFKSIIYKRAVATYFDEVKQNYNIDFNLLRKTIQEDIAKGLIPFWYGATVGSTFTGAVDDIDKLGNICKQYGMWLNVDAAYLGTSWVCDSLRDSQKGIEKVDSVYFNFSKVMFIGLNGCIFFVANKKQYLQLAGSSSIQFSILKNKYTQEHNVIDYHDWGIGMGKRFNSLKIFYLFKYYGMMQLRHSIQSRVTLAQYVQNRIEDSQYFEFFSSRSFLLVCFRCKLGDKNQNTRKLAPLVKDLDEGVISAGQFKGQWAFRIVICNMSTTQNHLKEYIDKIESIAAKFYDSNQLGGQGPR